MVRKPVRSILEEFSTSLMEVIIEKEYSYLVKHEEKYLSYMLTRLEPWGYTCSHTDRVSDDVVMTKFELKVTNDWGI